MGTNDGIENGYELGEVVEPNTVDEPTVKSKGQESDNEASQENSDNNEDKSVRRGKTTRPGRRTFHPARLIDEMN